MYIQTQTYSHTHTKTNNLPDMHMDMNKSMKITRDLRATYASNTHSPICSGDSNQIHIQILINIFELLEFSPLIFSSLNLKPVLHIFVCFFLKKNMKSSK